VDEYKYPGRMPTPIKINQRIAADWRRFVQLSHFLKDKNIPNSLKKNIMDTAVMLPSLT
jgi:hypothetical protein